MGYQTWFKVETKPSYDQLHMNVQAGILEEFEEYGFSICEFAHDELTADDEMTWYDHEEDLKKISKHYPDVVFDLFGIGEETGDIWHKYFKDGKMQRCRAIISFDEYNENKLV